MPVRSSPVIGGRTRAQRSPRVVVSGGGNGTSRLLRALFPLLAEGRLGALHALVHMADDGGSTGRLREQYGVPGMGDLSRCLMALSRLQGDVRGDEFLRALDYRFASGDFQGHTVRNAFLSALMMTSDLDTATATMARVLQVPKYAGVVPVTLKGLTQQVVITFDNHDNVLGEGEHSISHHVNLQADPRWRPGEVRVRFAEGDVPLNPRAAKVVAEATHLIVAPGHTYGTILPTLALPALGRALTDSPAHLWVVMTLLTTPRQTEGWRGEDFVQVYESYVGRPVELVVGNRGTATVALVPGQAWVRFRQRRHRFRLITDSVVSAEVAPVQAGDVVPRAIVVHDSRRLEEIFRRLL